MNTSLLDKSVLEQIFFAMENQQEQFFINLQSFEIIPSKKLPSEYDHTIILPIPSWNSTDGYNLMDKFVSTLKNPIAKMELNRSLQTRIGVFREFKKILKNYREVEQLWFNYRFQQMKQRVVDWYNDLQEELQLNALSDEIPEREDLIASNFHMRIIEDSEELSWVQVKDREAMAELITNPDSLEYWYQLQRIGNPHPKHDKVFGAYTPSEELSGFLWFSIDETPLHRKIARIIQLFVLPELRGLGIAEALIRQCLQHCDNEGISGIILENSTAILDNLLGRLGFSVHTKTFCRSCSAL